jgi:hypothetical protein
MRRPRLSRLAQRLRYALLQTPAFTEAPRCPACGLLCRPEDFDATEGECKGCVDQERVNVEWPDLGPFLPEEDE